MENQKSLILSLSTYILAFTLVCSCTPKEDFCRKDNVKKSRIMVPQLDSLFKAEDKPKIISQYLTLIEYENLAKIPDVIDSVQYLKYLGYESSESCVLELSALEFMNSEKYSSSESVIKSFVPILTISYTGKITKISGRIKVSKRGTSLSQIELDSMIDIKKVNALRKSYDKRLAKYNSEMEKINKKREAESKRQYQVSIQKQKEEVDRKKLEESNKTTNLVEIEKELNKTKEEVRRLYRELLSFKDNSDFHAYGFGIGYKYNKWMKDAEKIKGTSEGLNFLAKYEFSPGDLQLLGLEYLSTNGKETEYSIYIKRQISNGLKVK